MGSRLPLGMGSIPRTGLWVWDLGREVAGGDILPTARCCQPRPVVRKPPSSS